MKNRKRLVNNLIRILVTAAGIVFVVRQIDLDGLWQGLVTADWRLVGVTLLIFQLGIVIRAHRWRGLLTALGRPPSLLRLVGLYYSGAFFNTFLPTGFGGDVVRVLEIRQDTDTNAALATVGVDRLSGLYTLIGITFLTIPLAIPVLPRKVILLTGACCTLVISGWIIAMKTNWVVNVLSWLNPRIPFIDLSGVVTLAETLRTFSQRRLRNAIAASLAFNVLLIVSYYLMSLAFALDLPILSFAIITSFGSLLLLLPSVQGIGIREPVNVLLLGALGVAPERAVAFSVGIYLLSLSTGVIGAIYYAIYSIAAATRKQSTSSTQFEQADEPEQ